MAAQGGGPARLLPRGSNSGAVTRVLWKGRDRALQAASRERAGRAAIRTKKRRLASRLVMAPTAATDPEARSGAADPRPTPTPEAPSSTRPLGRFRARGPEDVELAPGPRPR